MNQKTGAALSLILLLGLTAASHTASAVEGSCCKSELKSKTPDGEVKYIDIDGDGNPDIIERWWNGKCVRWLNESGTMRKGDLRGDAVNDVLQIDMNGDGIYDGPEDMNIKWCDTDGDGIPDIEAICVNPKQWGATKVEQTGHPVWMVFINHDKHGVLGWVDWEKFNFNCWDFTGICNWLPNYHGNCDFVKTHVPPWSLADARLNWENPFSFYDETGDGTSKMAMRWCAPQPLNDGKTDIPPQVNTGFLTLDLDGNSGYGNETSYDMTIEAGGGNIDISRMVHPLHHFKGNPKFDCCFHHNEWRRIDELIYMDRNEGLQNFATAKFGHYSFVFDEDGDDHRWERVEMMASSANHKPGGPPVDLYSTARYDNKEGKTPGLDALFQADTLGDRGEFDQDGSGDGKLYIGIFDRKLHLYGAQWGAWTVDKNAEFHGGAGEPTKKPMASKVEEVVKYTDTDKDGFFDTIEYDYSGSRHIDLKVSLLDYKTKDNDPQKTELIEPGKLGWKGMHELFNKMAQASWIEALSVYRAACKRDLTTPELDKLAAASSMRQRYMNAYWIKEKVFRQIRTGVLARMETHPDEKAALQKYLENYIRAYYTGHFDEVVTLIGQAPSR
jgi:hypothetical protein